MLSNHTKSLLPKISAARSALASFQAWQTHYIYDAVAVSALLHSAMEEAAARQSLCCVLLNQTQSLLPKTAAAGSAVACN